MITDRHLKVSDMRYVNDLYRACILVTGMAARELGVVPCWALGSVGAIARFPTLDVKTLTIIGEQMTFSRPAYADFRPPFVQ